MKAPPEPIPGDSLVRTLSLDGSIAVRAIIASGLVGYAASRHGAAPTAAAALGRTLMGTLLMAAEAGPDETLQVQLRGDGPLGSVTVIASSDATVRGFVGNPAAHPPCHDGKLDVGAAVGKGILAVVRHHPSWREPYSGIVPLESGEVAEDLVRYLLESEQKASAMALGVFVGSDGSVDAAGGFLVQALPGARDESLAVLESNVRSLPSPTEMIRAGIDVDAMLDRLLDGLGARERHRIAPCFHCRCDRDRVIRAVALLGREEIDELGRRAERIEVRCEFCAERYEIEADEVARQMPSA